MSESLKPRTRHPQIDGQGVSRPLLWWLMKAMLPILALALMTFPACAAGSLKNPKDLVPPLKLTRADYYFDGGSLGGTLADSRGRHLDFFFSCGLNPDPHRLYIGFVSGKPNASMLPKFDGWSAQDLYLLIEHTIRDQFVWDAKARKLRPKQPDPHVFEDHDGFDSFVATQILKYVEKKLHRDQSYLK